MKTTDKSALIPLPPIELLAEHVELLKAEAKRRRVSLQRLLRDTVLDLAENLEDAQDIGEFLRTDDGTRLTPEDIDQLAKQRDVA